MTLNSVFRLSGEWHETRRLGVGDFPRQRRLAEIPARSHRTLHRFGARLRRRRRLFFHAVDLGHRALFGSKQGKRPNSRQFFWPVFAASIQAREIYRSRDYHVQFDDVIGIDNVFLRRFNNLHFYGHA